MLRSHKKITKKELKQDKVVLLSFKVVDYLEKKWKLIAGIAGGVIIIAVLTYFITQWNEKSDINEFDSAVTAYKNNASEAVDLMKKYIEKHGGSKRAAEVLIYLGNYYYTQKDNNSAEKYYKEFLKKFSKDSILSFNAYNGLGGIYADKGNFKDAAKLYEEYTAKYKDSPFLPIMYLSAGKTYYWAGDKESAVRNLKAIIDKFSDTREKQEAQFFLDTLSNTSSGL